MKIDLNSTIRLAGIAAAVIAVIEVIGVRGVSIPGGALEWAAVSVALSLAK